jgi:hypothetical protein
MQKEEKFVGSLANRAQTDDDKEGESSDGEDSVLNEFLVESSWSQAKKQSVYGCRCVRG